MKKLGDYKLCDKLRILSLPIGSILGIENMDFDIVYEEMDNKYPAKFYSYRVFQELPRNKVAINDNLRLENALINFDFIRLILTLAHELRHHQQSVGELGTSLMKKVNEAMDDDYMNDVDVWVSKDEEIDAITASYALSDIMNVNYFENYASFDCQNQDKIFRKYMDMKFKRKYIVSDELKLELLKACHTVGYDSVEF